MRLFLSSQDFGNYADIARRMAGRNNKAIFIKNAQDFKPEAERNSSNTEKKKMFEAAGFEFEMIDLRDYFGKPKELESKIKNAGSFWSSGGNTFVLRRAFAQSGLDKILIRLLKKDLIMYGGWSAGAMIVAPDLNGHAWGREDMPSVVPKDYDPKPIFDGLNLVNFYMVPHLGNPLHGKNPDIAIEYYESHNLPKYVLSDGQVIIVDGKQTEFLK